ncbi:MAG TPA: hypothetical protein VF487_13250 [Chitinophagaceae bacterium]
MKTTAYICDKCNLLKPEDECSGILANEALIDPINNSFTITKHCDMASYHFCLDCYREYVLNPAVNFSDRKNNEEGYRTLLRELTYTLKKTTIAEAMRREHLSRNRVVK